MKYQLLEASDVISPVLPPEAIVVNESTNIQEGDYAKIAVQVGKAKEIFWAVVYAIDRENDKFAVRINQDLVLTQYHGLSDEDELVVERKHIVAIIK